MFIDSSLEARELPLIGFIPWTELTHRCRICSGSAQHRSSTKKAPALHTPNSLFLVLSVHHQKDPSFLRAWTSARGNGHHCCFSLGDLPVGDGLR